MPYIQLNAYLASSVFTQFGAEMCMLRLRQDTDDMFETVVPTSLTVMTASC